MNKILKISVVGPQASGKGTQAEILARKFSLPIFSAGNSLRQRVAKGDKLGKEIEEIINKGKLVSDALVNKIIADDIDQEGEEGYILDGYPRNLKQVEFFDANYDLTYVFEIYISDKEAFRRISGRRTCVKCQAVYHMEYKPPQTEGVCDKCGAKLVIRDDEMKEAIKERLKVYHSLTEPILEHYREEGVYYRINGEQPISKVAEDILKIL